MPTQILVTDADLAALIQAAKATLAKIDAAVDKIAVAVSNVSDDIGNVSDSINEAIPLIQADVKEIADAAKTFKFSGPMGIHGQSS